MDCGLPTPTLNMQASENMHLSHLSRAHMSNISGRLLHVRKRSIDLVKCVCMWTLFCALAAQAQDGGSLTNAMASLSQEEIESLLTSELHVDSPASTVDDPNNPQYDLYNRQRRA